MTGKAAIGSAEFVQTPVPPALNDHPRYRVVRPLGQGGMGAVFLAEHIRMERRVALKVVNSTFIQDEQALQRFQQEVRAASKLSHPNIVTAFDADEAGEGPQKSHFLVMEFIEGETLSDYISRKGPLPAGEACRYVLQAALGLQHAYEQGMVHRDIKPQNLLRSMKGEIKILDFGLARLARIHDADGNSMSQLTNAGAIMGTIDYMAPEQASDSRSVDIRADIYSLGCTLYQLLCGQVPFAEGSIAARLVRHATVAPVPLRQSRPEIPEALEAIVARMLAKKPEERFETPADVAAALSPFADQVPLSGADLSAERAAVADELRKSTVTGIATPAKKASSPAIRPPTLAPAVPLSSEAVPPRAKVESGSAFSPTLVGKVAPVPIPVPVTASAAVPAAETSPRMMRLGLAGAALLVIGLLIWAMSGTKKVETVPPVAEATIPKPNIPVAQAASPVVETESSGERTKAASEATPQFSSEAISRADESRRILGAPAAGMQVWLAGLSREGWVPTNITVQAGSPEALFSAVAIKDATRKFAFIMDTDALAPSAPDGTGWRVASECVHLRGGRLRMARIFLQNNGTFVHWSGTPATVLQKMSGAEARSLLRPSSISLVQDAEGKEQLFVQMTGSTTAWDVHPGVDLNALKDLESNLRAAGRRIELLSAYGNAEPFHFIVEDVDNSKGPEWKLMLDQSQEDFERSVRDEASRSFRPWCVAGYGNKQSRYASVWIKAAR